MDLWSKGILKPLLLPGGILLGAAFFLLQSRLLPLASPAVSFYYYAAFAAGTLLAWRFHSGRVLFALITLFLAHSAVEMFSAWQVVTAGPGYTVLQAVAVLLPLNFVIFSVMGEQGLGFPAVTPRATLLFFEAAFVAVIARPAETAAPSQPATLPLLSHSFPWAGIPQIGWISYAAALAILLLRFLLYHKPVESGMLWSLAASFFGLRARAVGGAAHIYVATGALILTSSIIENSYVLAYHDELTGLPARRSFNDALRGLRAPYTVAVVDIDHFKNFNDTYGHETGDHVLRMVAARLARVSGGGQAYRVGGEEFTILFPGMPVKDALPHLELLRTEVEFSAFHLRTRQERRSLPNRTDRRRPMRPRKPGRSRRDPVEPPAEELSVTVSIGVAEPTGRIQEAERVVQAADKALYRAKRSGRNRVETSAELSRVRRNIA
ncbi:MAG TPA: GGDEF domain-containing protein [Terriglobales bacterium]|nr:GGDEF domain-containing protein [Terriglobales bacterium]